MKLAINEPERLHEYLSGVRDRLPKPDEDPLHQFSGPSDVDKSLFAARHQQKTRSIKFAGSNALLFHPVDSARLFCTNYRHGEYSAKIAMLTDFDPAGLIDELKVRNNSYSFLTPSNHGEFRAYFVTNGDPWVALYHNIRVFCDEDDAESTEVFQCEHVLDLGGGGIAPRLFDEKSDGSFIEDMNRFEGVANEYLDALYADAKRQGYSEPPNNVVNLRTL